jgi:hypothetical protein
MDLQPGGAAKAAMTRDPDPCSEIVRLYAKDQSRGCNSNAELELQRNPVSIAGSPNRC